MERHETDLGPLGADLPDPASERTQNGAQAESGAHDEPEALPGGDDGEGIEQTAPIFPAETILRDFLVWLQKLPGGGMQLKIGAAVATPMGKQPSPPVFVVDFDPGSWEAFQETVAAGAVPKPSGIIAATQIPEHLARGL